MYADIFLRLEDYIYLDQRAKSRLDIHNSDVPLLCRSCEARHKGICGALAPNQLQALSKHTTKHVVGAEQQIASFCKGQSVYKSRGYSDRSWGAGHVKYSFQSLF